MPFFSSPSGKLSGVLKQWILGDRRHLIFLYGMVGIGKTTLANALVQQIQQDFEFVIWRSLRNQLPIHDLLNDVLRLITNAAESNHIDDSSYAFDLDRTLTKLHFYLQQHRCLLVLDNLDSILVHDQHTQKFLPGYERYGQLLRYAATGQHQSCILITAREQLRYLIPLQSPMFSVQSLKLTGLNTQNCRQILEQQGHVFGTDQDWKQITHNYSGNPLFLQFISSTIKNFFSKNLNQFLEFTNQKPFLENSIRGLLDSQFSGLTSLEKELLQILALNKKYVNPIAIKLSNIEIHNNIHLIDALNALSQCCLIESEDQYISLLPIIQEYIMQRLNS